jgi:sodium/hydrogen antiporter
LHELYVALAVIGGLLLVLWLLMGLINNTAYASEPLIALIAGILIGPAALGWLNLSAVGNQQDILEQASLVTLAVALVGVALRLPVGFITNNWRRIFSVGGALGLAFVTAWMVGGLVVWPLASFLATGFYLLAFATEITVADVI